MRSLSTHRTIGAVAALSLAAAVALLPPPRIAHGQAPAAFSFGLIGDLGYQPHEEPWLDAVMSDLDRHVLAFVVHVGDLATPTRACTDALQAQRLAQFRASAHPLIFTPGDNEWTDCHDAQGVKGGNPLERLATLRKLFFAGEESLGKRTLPLLRQSKSADPVLAKYRENARWDLGGVTFMTLHVVGSNNGRGRAPETDAEYEERNRANLVWLREGFAHATASNSRGIMILTQANLYPDFPPFPAPGGKEASPSGFADMRDAVEQEAIAFRKPIVLVHGDSHYFRIDNPYRARPPSGRQQSQGPENFLRLELFGSPSHHWVEVTVSPDDPNVFTIRPRIVAENLVKRSP
jgi:hypothetical protein